MLMVKSRMSHHKHGHDSEISNGNFDTAARLAAESNQIRRIAYNF
jgi:hypothetical protein